MTTAETARATGYTLRQLQWIDEHGTITAAQTRGVRYWSDENVRALNLLAWLRRRLRQQDSKQNFPRALELAQRHEWTGYLALTASRLDRDQPIVLQYHESRPVTTFWATWVDLEKLCPCLTTS